MDDNGNSDNIQLDKVAVEHTEKLGKPTNFICPKCSHMLWELDYEELPYFRCSLGHIYSPKSLLVEQMTALKIAFRRELRAFQEKQPWLSP